MEMNMEVGVRNIVRGDVISNLGKANESVLFAVRSLDLANILPLGSRHHVRINARMLISNIKTLPSESAKFVVCYLWHTKVG